MKRAVWALVALTLAASPAAAQTEWANKLFENADDGPSDPAARSRDFGTCPKGAQLKHTFKMKNIYKVPLDITEVRPTCSACLTYTLSKKTLQPNEKGELHILMDASRFDGPKVINIYVRVGPQFVSTATLTVQANARKDVTFNPGSVNFGVVGRGQTPTQALEVEYAGDLDWRLSEIVKSAAAPFAITAEELYRIPSQPRRFLQPAVPGKVGYRLTLKLKADAPAGPFKQELVLKTNDPASPVLTVAVDGKIQASLTVAPPVVDLKVLKVGETKTVRVFVRGSRAFRITGIEGHGDGLKVELPALAQETHILVFHLEAKQPGELRRQIRIRTDLDNESTLVTLEAIIEGREKSQAPPP